MVGRYLATRLAVLPELAYTMISPACTPPRHSQLSSTADVNSEKENAMVALLVGPTSCPSRVHDAAALVLGCVAKPILAGTHSVTGRQVK